MTSPPISSIQQHKAAPQSAHKEMYETDFAEWINEAASLLKQGQFSELEIHHFPAESPYNLKQVLDADFLPGE